jgi:hypothetical protein
LEKGRRCGDWEKGIDFNEDEGRQTDGKPKEPQATTAKRFSSTPNSPAATTTMSYKDSTNVHRRRVQ